ncbi:CBS domain-containing protein [uncultured Bilophila sp.]|uniref:CBS domain-containing protein n=1 Tax=uncultured Bilophila sp. TaxID=529385 RepID=UPI0025D02C05|nr:CBS domain-containing protein [uncultured Bilophila sp.]
MNRTTALRPPESPLPTTEDIFRSMKEMEAYVDITMEDFQALYNHAGRLARHRLLFSVTAADVMHSPTLCVRESDPVSHVVAFLERHGISGAPVLDGRGGLAGIVSERDILRLCGDGVETPMHLLGVLLRGTCRLPDKLKEAVAAIMTREVRTASPATPLAELVALMRRYGINRLPVLDEAGKTVGIVSRTDLVNTLGKC